MPPSDIQASPDCLPDPFGPYRIVKRLGEGGMGTVYLAHDTRLGRDVALKVCRLADRQPQALERFHREARAAAALRHPNLCPVYDVGEVAGIHYLTMAYIKGPTLARRLAEQGPFEQGKAIELVHRLARAMHRAHDAGVIHRDLKPSNIGFEPDGEPVVLDFGLARLTGAETSHTPDGAILGTPVYMSPEQARGDQEAIGPATDIYSLGVILYQLLTGQVPFSGPFAAVVAQILYGPSPSPLAVRPDLDLRLVDVCARAMARQPADRYPTMEAFAAALEAIGTPASLEGPSSGSPPSTREVTGGTAANLPPTLPTTPTDTTTGDEVAGTMRHPEVVLAEPVRPWWSSWPWPVRWPLLLFWWPLAWLATGAAWLVRRPRWLGGVVVLVLAGGLAIWLATRTPQQIGRAHV